MLTNLQFETHHEESRIQTHNIHDRANLVALCSICHFAYDNDEWTFIPEETTVWTQSLRTSLQDIKEYNSRRDVIFRRVLLSRDRYSKAFEDAHYVSAFIKTPIKIWPGESGLVIMRPPFSFPPKITAELRKTLDDFEILQKLWRDFQDPCFKENCPICQSNSEGKQENEDEAKEGNDTDDEHDDDEDEDDEDDNDIDDDGNDDENEEENEEEDEEDNEKDQNLSSSGEKTSTKKHRKKKGNTNRDWMTSTPYDKSIPYSHRYGYTWAGSTSNELMKLWQVYRKPVEE